MRSTRHGNPFSFCQTWGQAVFFRSEAGSSYLSQYGENGGGRTRENPRFRKNPRPREKEDDFLSDGPSERKTVPDEEKMVVVETCPGCGKESYLEEGASPGTFECPYCHFRFDVKGV